MTSRLPAIDDPQVMQAMAVYDNLNPNEQREVFRTMYRSVTASHRAGNNDAIRDFADSLRGMVRLESQHPGARDAIRAAASRRLPSDPGAGTDLGVAIEELRDCG